MLTTITRALAKSRAAREDNQKGFTLIELLVVVLIIGVLAAIAIPAFLAQREGAWKAQIQNDIRSATTAAESYAADNNGSVTNLTNGAKATGTAAKLSIKDYGFNPTTGVAIEITVNDTAYTIAGYHKQLADGLEFSSTTGKSVKKAKTGTPAFAG